MRFWDYIKDRIGTIVALAVANAFIVVFLDVVGIGRAVLIFISLVIWVAFIGGSVPDYLRRRRFYVDLLNRFDGLDQKYLISEMLDNPYFYDGEVFCKILAETNKSMNDEIQKYHLKVRDYREYIETWVHEIKTPIATCSLLCDNSLQVSSKEVRCQLENIEKFVEQALYYSRSASVEKDYMIKRYNLKELIASAVKKSARILISQHIAIDMENLDCDVFTDSKWTEFILGQILQNSTKYMEKPEKKIIFSAIETKTSVILSIADNGIGISEKDISRVFEKGFTGENGRKYAKSTGIGLYLCRSLCMQMGMNITLASEQGKGTTVKLIFPKSDLYRITES